MTARARCWAALAGLFLGTVAVYAPSLRGGFVYDDHWAIGRNAALRHASLRQFWTDPSTGANPASGLAQDVYRPLTVTSFFISGRLWGADVPKWRLENLCWHVLNGWLIFLLLRRLWPKEDRAAPLFATAIFLLHPLQVSAVAWVYQRGALISAAGCLTALCLVWAPWSVRRFGAAMVCLTAALFAKETAVVFPLILAALAWDHRVERLRTWIVGSVLLVVGFALWRGYLLGWTQIADVPRGFGTRMALTVLALPQYAAKVVMPFGLRASYDVPTPLGAWRGAAAMVGTLALIGWGIWLVRHRSRSRGFFVFALAALLPMLPLAPVRAFFAERFFYLSMVGAAALIARGALASRAARVLMTVWLMALSVETVFYARAWRTDASLWRWSVAREPRNAFAHICLAETLPDRAAAAEYWTALHCPIAPDMRANVLNNLAVLALAQGHPAEALEEADDALRAIPNHPQALFNRWRALAALGRKGEADALGRQLSKDERIPAEIRKTYR